MESGEMFVFERHVCFRRTQTALFDPAKSGGKPTKFAVPAFAVVDAAPNPSVYPFGGVLLAIDGVGDPWLFSFFTERNKAIETINAALDAAIDPVRRSAMRAKHAEERERRARERETSRDELFDGRGVDCRDRTRDLSCIRRMLYQLSYRSSKMNSLVKYLLFFDFYLSFRKGIIH